MMRLNEVYHTLFIWGAHETPRNKLLLGDTPRSKPLTPLRGQQEIKRRLDAFLLLVDAQVIVTHIWRTEREPPIFFRSLKRC